MFRGISSLITIVYLIIGAVVAADRNYFKGVNKAEEVLEAALAVLLWPLVLLGVDMRF